MSAEGTLRLQAVFDEHFVCRSVPVVLSWKYDDEARLKQSSLTETA